ncbi:hypothetical protein ACG10_21790 (plasmid) [Azotobacter chroococcum]|nr:hypothetical protein ACG10_21790 [Azotobacter chroococcum]
MWAFQATKWLEINFGRPQKQKGHRGVAFRLALAFQVLDQFFEISLVGGLTDKAERIVGKNFHDPPFDIPEGFMRLGGSNPVGDATHHVYRVFHNQIPFLSGV